MNPIEKAARNLCRIDGQDADALLAGAPHWTAYLPQVMGVIEALYEPGAAMKEAGSEVIRHVGHEETEAAYYSDAANVWRFMIDALRQDGQQTLAKTIGRRKQTS